MKRFLAGALFVACVTMATDADAQLGRTYPRVYGATGRPYGPTQAHYQYQRQYGRPWHGGGGGGTFSGRRRSFGVRHFGGHVSHHVHFRHRGFGSPFRFGIGYYYYPFYRSFGFGAGAYPYYVPRYAYVRTVPPIVTTQPVIVPNRLKRRASKRRGDLAELARLKKLLPGGDNDLSALSLRPSNDKAKLRSIRLQGQGDIHLRKQEFAKAYTRFRRASKAARVRPEPYFRMGLALAAMGRYDAAIREIKLGLRLDPIWPLTGEDLDNLYGHENESAKTQLLYNVADWVREDIYDPDRLFLIGVLLHFNNEVVRARPFFETADRLGSSPRHVQLFLNPQTPKQAPQPPSLGPHSKQQGPPVPKPTSPQKPQEATHPQPNNDVQTAPGGPVFPAA